jgi:hypothetical protein
MTIEGFLFAILVVEIVKTVWVVYADSVIINYKRKK